MKDKAELVIRRINRLDRGTAQGLSQHDRECRDVAQAYLNPWISVKERLPEDDSWVLAVSAVSGRVVYVTYREKSRHDDTKVFMDPHWIELRGGIKCWTPLPNPPKE